MRRFLFWYLPIGAAVIAAIVFAYGFGSYLRGDTGSPVDFGARPATPDMKPIIGPAPDHKNLWFAFGHAHQGFITEIQRAIGIDGRAGAPVVTRLGESVGGRWAGEVPVDAAAYALVRFHIKTFGL